MQTASQKKTQKFLFGGAVKGKSRKFELQLNM